MLPPGADPRARHRGGAARARQAARPGRAGGRVRRGPAAGRADPGRRGVEATAAAHPAPELPAAVPGLGRRPRGRECPTWTPDRPERGDWLLIGCERSVQFHRHFYGDEPERVDLCPRNRSLAAGKVLTKCCLIERGLEVDGDTAVVPWGANLDEVREGLRKLLAVSPTSPTPRLRPSLDHARAARAVRRPRPHVGLADHPRRVGAGPGRRRAGARRGRRADRASTRRSTGWTSRWSPRAPAPPGTRRTA